MIAASERAVRHRDSRQAARIVITDAYELAEDACETRALRVVAGDDGRRRRTRRQCRQFSAQGGQRAECGLGLQRLRRFKRGDFGRDSLPHRSEQGVFGRRKRAVGEPIRGDRGGSILEQSKPFAGELQHELGFVQRKRIAAGQALIGKVRNCVLECPRTLARSEQFLAHAAVDRFGIAEARAQRVDVTPQQFVRAFHLIHAQAECVGTRGA